MRLPEKITDLPADALFGTKEIVFRPGEGMLMSTNTWIQAG